MQAILALDQGTTSSRAIVFGRDGLILSSVQQEFRQIFPQPGWVEHDPLEIWRTQRDVAAAALAKSGLSGADVAIGITNQRETTLLWERSTGLPVANAIVWQDRRTASRCDALRQQGHEATFARKTGLGLDAYFSGTKLAWLLENVPGARARAERGELAFGTVDTWLAWQLSGGAYHASSGKSGPHPSAGGIAIAGIAGDQQAALFGQACHAPGMAKNTYGTGCFLLMNTGEKPAASANRLLTTIAWQRGGRTSYALEGSVFIAGAAIQWLRDGLGLIARASEVDALAASVPDTGGVHFVPALSGLGAPYWDARARGLIVGITRGTTRAHLARATLEAIAFQSAELIEAMAADSAIALTELRVDGGATASDLLMQIQADLLGVPVVRPKVTETTALGAAYLAGLAVGFWKDETEIASLWARERTFTPAMARATAAGRMGEWRRAVERSRNWAGDA